MKLLVDENPPPRLVHDLADLGLTKGAPPKVILLQTGNCSTVELIRIIRNNAIRFADIENNVKRSLLVLR